MDKRRIGDRGERPVVSGMGGDGSFHFGNDRGEKRPKPGWLGVQSQ